jgi:hypothetical protein
MFSERSPDWHDRNEDMPFRKSGISPNHANEIRQRYRIAVVTALQSTPTWAGADQVVTPRETLTARTR